MILQFAISDVLQYAVIAVSIASLAYGGFTDVKTRTVKAFLFIPLAFLGVIYNFTISAPSMFIVLGIVTFLLTFLEPDTYAYLIIGAVIFAISVFSFVMVGFYWGFELIVIAIVYVLGFQERLFGIGDIKAIIAIVFSSTIYSPLVGLVVGNRIDYTIVPTGLSLLTDISFFAVLFVFYAIYLLSKHGTARVNGQPMAMKYDEKLEGKNPHAYRRQEKHGISYLIYKIPFIVPIGLGYILFLVVGFVLFLL